MSKANSTNLHKTKKSLSAPNSQTWCNIVDALQTSAVAALNDYKLKHLVEQFQLSGNLI